MLDRIVEEFLKSTIYVRIRSDLLSVTQVERRNTFEDKPLLALKVTPKGKKLIVAVGAEAEAAHYRDPASVSVYNAFDHPRSCIKDFEIGKETLKYFVSKAVSRKAILRPVIVMHPLEKLEGGLTDVESLALVELGSYAGARKVYVWTGRILDPQELLTLRFPEAEGQVVRG